MVTLPSRPVATESHHARQMAESFGVDTARYDRTRPRYPQALVDRIVAASPGVDVLDVGIGTGISARPFREVGCRVFGVEPDERMAAFARQSGFEVEVATFETWDPAGRSFDAVIAGQAWHWVDPAAGATKAARLLRPGGRLAVFWNAMELPPDIRDAFSEAFRQAVAGSPFPRDPSRAPGGYSAFFAQAADGIRRAGAFGEPEQWRVDWERPYTRDEWLEVVPTAGGFNQLPPAELAEVLARLGTAIDAAGGTFIMRYAAVAVTATLTDDGPQ
jgi:SAM-dependent methyltransferase